MSDGVDGGPAGLFAGDRVLPVRPLAEVCWRAVAVHAEPVGMTQYPERADLALGALVALLVPVAVQREVYQDLALGALGAGDLRRGVVLLLAEQRGRWQEFLPDRPPGRTR